MEIRPMTHLAQIELLRILTNHHPGLHVHDRAALENALSAGYSLPSEASAFRVFVWP